MDPKNKSRQVQIPFGAVHAFVDVESKNHKYHNHVESGQSGKEKTSQNVCLLPIRPNSEESEFFFETQLLIYYPVLYCEFKTARKFKRMNGTVKNKFNAPFHTLEVELCSKTSTNSLFSTVIL